SLLNLAGTLAWSMDETSYGFVRGDSLTIYNIADLEDEVVEDSSWSVEGGDDFRQKPPARLCIGTAFEIRDWLLTLDYLQGFSRTAWHGTTPQFALGAEWRPLRWLPLRAGCALGGDLGVGTSIGLGIHPGGFIFDLALMNNGFVTPGQSKGWIAAVEIAMILR
ncbi:hypothetical protein JW992_14280, partial [candidate division KSB1 bacterium]|nr:hypothetical protein [candidate division KSB1 bacterium]